MTDEQDFTDPDFVLEAVLAQVEDLSPLAAWEVLKQALDCAFRRSEAASDDADAEERDEGFPEGATVAVQFSVEMYVHVDLNTGLPTQTIVQTPNVASMDEVDAECVRWGEDVDHRYGREATDAEKAEAIKILDNTEWPTPELVA